MKKDEIEAIEPPSPKSGDDILPARFMTFIKENPASKLARLCLGERDDQNGTLRSG